MRESYLNRFFLLPLFFLLLSFTSKSVIAQNVSNEGTDFYAVFPTHIPSSSRDQFNPNIIIRPLANYSVFITGKEASSGVVSVGSFSQQFNVIANQVTEVQVPRDQAYIDASVSGRVLSNKAIHIVVDANKPRVVVWGHIFAGARSAASLILPTEATGKQYLSMNYANNIGADGGDNFIVVVASEANTKVFLRRKDGSEIVSGGITLTNPGDIFEYLAPEDLTGVQIIADEATSQCKRFAVFSGNTNVNVSSPGCFGTQDNAMSSDPLYQQNYPVESWGTTYGFVPFSSASVTGGNTRTAGSYYRVLAKTDGTVVKFNGTTVATLKAGDFYQPANPSNVPGIITASNPVAVAQYALSQACAGGGVSDPDMVILNPVEYSIKNITVYSSSKENILEQYINILIKTSAVASFRINGVRPSGNFKPLPGSTEYSYLQLNLNSLGTQNFNLSASEGFNAIAYGFGRNESYAYSAGTNLASTQSIAAVRLDSPQELTSACTKEVFQFKLTLPEKAIRIRWHFDTDPEIVQVQSQLAPTEVIRNGQTFYVYNYPKTSIFNIAGQKDVNVVVTYEGLNSCYPNEDKEIDFLFDVFDPPTASFTMSADVCPQSPVVFTDKSFDTDPAKLVVSWLWDFGDGSPVSSLQNPSHIYTTPGNYNVKLIAKGSTGCSSDVYSQVVRIKPGPVALFTTIDGTCTSNVITFNDASSSPDGTLNKWIWDFGDRSAPVTKTTRAPFTYNYAQAGVYNVTLKVVNSTNCESAVFTLAVTAFAPSLTAGPDVYVLEGGQVQLNAVAEGVGIMYRWSPSIGLDRDDIKNPKASPTENTSYTVTITTEQGCILSDDVNVSILANFVIPNTFTPNADGINDVWKIEYLDTYVGATVDIYNRYGVKIFNSRGYGIPWDGKYKGEELPVGTYYYIIGSLLGRDPISGSVTIIR